MAIRPAASPLRSPFPSAMPSADSLNRSSVSQMAIAFGLTEVHQKQNQTTLVYRKDQSLALRAISATDLNLKQETYRVELTLTADQVGLSSADFSNPKQPITLNLSFRQSHIQIEHNLKARLVKPIRTAEEIITDVAKALAKVMRDPSNKTVRYELDEEARQALIGADLRLWEELILMMAMINLQQRSGEPRNDYLILVSGKRSPYLDFNEYKDIRAESLQIEIQITILPPASQSEGDGKNDPSRPAPTPD
jgi:hypothetical protein